MAMNKNKHYKDQLILLHFGELTPEEAEEVRAHLSTCPECRKEQKKLEKLCQLMDQRILMEPPSTFWNHYWNKLRPKLKAGAFARWRFFLPRLRQQRYPRWALVAATSAFLFIIGISWLWFAVIRENIKTTDENVAHIKQQQELSVPFAQVKRATVDYLYEVKPIVLQVANAQPNSQGGGMDFSLEKEASQQLLLQNRLLRGAAGKRFDPQLQSLFEDIELFLIDVSNLEEDDSRSSIAFLKENMNDLSMKIDLVTTNLAR
jgi:hypothetical protein